MYNIKSNTNLPLFGNSLANEEELQYGFLKSIKKTAAGVGSAIVFSLTFSGVSIAASPVKYLKTEEELSAIEIKSNNKTYSEGDGLLISEHDNLEPEVNATYYSNTGGMLVMNKELHEDESLIISDYIIATPKKIFDLENDFDFKKKGTPNYHLSTDRKISDDILIQAQPKKIFDI